VTIIFKFSVPNTSLERLKQGTSNLVCRLTLTGTSACKRDFSRRGYVKSHVTSFCLGE